MHIKVLKPSHQHRWEKLFRQYAEFYHTSLPQEAVANVWQWLLDPSHPLCGLMAFNNHSAVGFMHYRPYPKSLSGQQACFVDDIFVTPRARSKGVATTLLQTLEKIASIQGWSSLRWITAEDNYPARKLYDCVAQKTQWQVYEKTIATNGTLPPLSTARSAKQPTSAVNKPKVATSTPRAQVSPTKTPRSSSARSKAAPSRTPTAIAQAANTDQNTTKTATKATTKKLLAAVPVKPAHSRSA